VLAVAPARRWLLRRQRARSLSRSGWVQASSKHICDLRCEFLCHTATWIDSARQYVLRGLGPRFAFIGSWALVGGYVIIVAVEAVAFPRTRSEERRVG